MIVHIGGWPGVGKLTIGRMVATSLGARLLDNHTLINPAEALMTREDPSYWALRSEFRRLAFDVAQKAPPDTRFVLTDALGENDPRDLETFADVRRLAERRGSPLFCVVLDCGMEENTRRLITAEREPTAKLRNPEVLARLRADYVLLRPNVGKRLDLDVTELTAAAAAERILTFVRLT